MGNSSSARKDVVTGARMKMPEEAVVETGTRLYVANLERPTISVIDADTGQVIRTIAAGDLADQLVLNSARTRLYVTSYRKWSGNWKLFVIDTNSDKVIAKIGVGKSCGALLLNSAETQLYVVDKGSNSIIIINTNSRRHKVIATVDVGKSPGALILHSAGIWLYVANKRSDNVSVINTYTQQVIATIGVGGCPKALSLNATGTRLYVVNKESNDVSVINTSNHQVIATISVGQSPRNLALNPAGTCLYVENKGWGDGGSISVIDTHSHQMMSILPYRYPKILALDAERDRLYVVGYAESSRGWDFFVIDTYTHCMIDTISVDMPLNARRLPTVFALDLVEMRFYAVNSGSGNIHVIDTKSRQKVETIAVGKYPRAIGIREKQFA
jgi:YVTN family beta-propeller protein